MNIDLVWLSHNQIAPPWPLGQVCTIQPTHREIAQCVKTHLNHSSADAWLFWDAALGSPNAELIETAANLAGDVWHAGLKMEMCGEPGVLDFVQPTWMLNRDPDPAIEATSWRLSLRCCLIKTDVIRQMGGPLENFQSLKAASLELGYRYIRRGVFVRYIPWLLPEGADLSKEPLSFEDELRFLYHHHNHRWCQWAMFRAVWTGYASPKDVWRAWNVVSKECRQPISKPYHRDLKNSTEAVRSETVSVLIPTVNRYPYLRTLLDQLRRQTVKPHEIIIIDQTEVQDRDLDLGKDFSDLPMSIDYLEKPGQCSSRNLGLLKSRGDYILFLDDDEEIEPDIIEKHLKTLIAYQCCVSSGVVEDPQSGPLPEDFKYIRLNDTFPAGNTLINKTTLNHSGLFDLAYDHGQRADGDLGMRVHLSGEMMVLNPEISIFHHRAPVGGLREHGARKITYGSSRRSLVQRRLLSATEVYLARRYFNNRQQQEQIWLNVLGTFSIQGKPIRKILKVMISFFVLPDSINRIKAATKEAEKMMKSFPQIPTLKDFRI